MSTKIFPTLVVATSVGLALNAYFISGSLALTNAAVPAILLPENAMLMPPLAFVHKRRSEHFRRAKFSTKTPQTETSESETRATYSSETEPQMDGSTPSTTNYILRQWFHVFAAGMASYPLASLAATTTYLFCFFAVPGKFLAHDQPWLVTKRGLYGLAACLSAGSQIFTLTAMKPVNSALNQRIEEVCEQERLGGSLEDQHTKKEETTEMIRRWGKMNTARTLFPTAAAFCATILLALPF